MHSPPMPSTTEEVAAIPIPSRAPKQTNFDWTAVPPSPKITPFQRFIHGVDWASSPLGPMQTWPAQLRQMVMLVVADPSPAVIYWDNEEGIEEAIVYNEAYVPLIGQKHPSLQGQDPRIGFSEIWDTFTDILRRGRDDFETVVQKSQPLMLERHGFLEETWFSWKFVPIVGPHGYVVGSYATVIEVTREVILDRRVSTIRSIDEQMNLAIDLNDLWTRIAVGIQPNQRDIPVVLLYSCDILLDPTSLEHSPPQDRKICRLEGSLGIEPENPAVPKLIDIHKQNSGMSDAIREAMSTGRPKPFRLEDGFLAPEIFEAAKFRGWEIPCRKAVICPIKSALTKRILGVIILVLNPRRPFDEDYQNFVDLFMQQTSTAASRLRLSEQLTLRTIDLKQSETKFSRFASRAPVGLAIFTSIGELTYANEGWYNMTKFSKDVVEAFSWITSIIEEDQNLVAEWWDQILKQKTSVKIQYRLKATQVAPDSNITPTTVLCCAFPDMDNSGNINSVMTCLTDVTELKWVEDQLRRRTHDVEQKMLHVLDMKRQQENFIDMTSHEIRNPLSAVLHCAEEIFTTLNDVLKKEPEHGIEKSALSLPTKAVIESCIEAAETINYCVLHQKRIVDDILVLSRLDTQLLEITPVPTQPTELIQGSLKMFEAELKTAGMTLDFHEDPSLQQLNIRFLNFDPNRVIQILVNLVGNAIKFTRSEETRKITVSLSVSTENPSQAPSGIEFVPTKDQEQHLLKVSDWGEGEVIYMRISVVDSGQGLTPEEKRLLFQRFSQASPKTHTKYGGSGLGLFISRQLTELHGGQIGVISEAGKGSNFFFFVQTHRSVETNDDRRRSSVNSRQLQEDIRHLSGGGVATLQIEDKSCGISPNPSGESVSSNILNPEPILSVPSDTPQLNVLVVEDNLVNQKVLSKQLRKFNCTVYIANHGEEALEFLKNTTFWHGVDKGLGIDLSIILMDLEMPVMDGLTTVKNIRDLQKDGSITAHIPTIAVTANARREQLERALAAGMDDVIIKPYRIPEMMEQVWRFAYQHCYGNIGGDSALIL